MIQRYDRARRPHMQHLRNIDEAGAAAPKRIISKYVMASSTSERSRRTGATPFGVPNGNA